MKIENKIEKYLNENKKDSLNFVEITSWLPNWLDENSLEKIFKDKNKKQEIINIFKKNSKNFLNFVNSKHKKQYDLIEKNLDHIFDFICKSLVNLETIDKIAKSIVSDADEWMGDSEEFYDLEKDEQEESVERNFEDYIEWKHSPSNIDEQELDELLISMKIGFYYSEILEIVKKYLLEDLEDED